MALAVTSIMAPTLAFGQTPDAGALQRQLQNEADRDRPMLLPEPQIKRPEVSAPTDSVNRETVFVKGFKVTGITLITSEQAQDALVPFCNRALTLDNIKEAAIAVTNLYTKIGRVARAIVPEQDATTGTIEIRIMEGKMGGVKIDLDPTSPSRLKTSLIEGYVLSSNPQDELLDLNALERSLALLNETSGNRVSGNLAPGSRDGSVDVVINAQDIGLISGKVDLANYGSANTGTGQVLANLSLNNPTGNADQVTIDAIGSLGSAFGQIRYGMPVGYDGWKISAGTSLFEYKTLSSFSTPQNMAQGSAQTYGLYSSYALERGAKSSKDFNIFFENKNYVNRNVSTGIEFQNYQINNLGLSLSGVNLFGRDLLSWSGTVTAGHLGFSNAKQETSDSYGPLTKGNFAKLSFSLSLSTPLEIVPLTVMSSIYGQLANKNLSSSEQFYLGGPYGVRAYPSAQGGGAQGAIASIELTHNYQNQLKLGAFVDAGLVEQYKTLYPGWQGNTNANNVYPLFSAGPVVRYSYENVQLSAVAAFRIGNNPLHTYSGQQLNVDNRYNSVQVWAKGTVFF